MLKKIIIKSTELDFVKWKKIDFMSSVWKNTVRPIIDEAITNLSKNPKSGFQSSEKCKIEINKKIERKITGKKNHRKKNTKIVSK